MLSPYTHSRTAILARELSRICLGRGRAEFLRPGGRLMVVDRRVVDTMSVLAHARFVVSACWAGLACPLAWALARTSLMLDPHSHALNAMVGAAWWPAVVVPASLVVVLWLFSLHVLGVRANWNSRPMAGMQAMGLDSRTDMDTEHNEAMVGMPVGG